MRSLLTVVVYGGFAGVALCFVAGAAWAQCAMCRSTLASPEAQVWAASLRRGIVLLMLAPLLTFAVIAVAATRERHGLEEHLGGKYPQEED